MNSQALQSLPAELRDSPQWLLAGLDQKGEYKIPLTVGNSGRLQAASVTAPVQWLDFEYALACAAEFGCMLGYVLSADDPFCCVDLDVKNVNNRPNTPEDWTSEEDLERLQSIARHLDSYSELSQSGQGVHVWVRAKIGPGHKRDGVEIYSQQRFIVCTGHSLHTPAKPIAERQHMLEQMASQMSELGARAAALDDGTTDIEDNELLARANKAENGSKFAQLWRGEWQGMGYPSQSEADLSLMSMLTFYSRDNEQCRRLFRQSALGQRPKAVDSDRYLDYTLRLIRGRQQREDAAMEGIRAQAAEMLARATIARAAQPHTVAAGMQAPDPATVAAAAAYAAALQATGPALHLPPTGPGAVPPAPLGALQWPPGLVGDIAKFVYGAAPRPVREVAIVAALGWIAGVCGKAWVFPGSGLNLYIILVARSAIGKEAMHTGLAALTTRIREGQPVANNFINFSEFASGPALAKACAESSSFVNVSGEFGKRLQQLAQNAHGPMQTLRTVMTHLYQKSGPASIVGGIGYSNKENNVASISGVAYSMIGETTPDTLYASLTESMMEDGFLSRFTIVEYEGNRPPMNHHANLVPETRIVEQCQALCGNAATMIANHTRVMMRRSEAAGALMDAFDLECDAQINSSTDESWRQMWNRAHLKMCRIASLIAIGCCADLSQPVIEVDHVEWALDVVRRDIGVMQKRMSAGDVGQGDTAREKKLLHMMHEYLHNPLPESYGVPQIMQRDGVVPRKYLQIRASRVSAFVNHHYGTKRALDDAISSLCDSGYIAEIDKVKAGEAYTFQGRCFKIVQLPKFN